MSDFKTDLSYPPPHIETLTGLHPKKKTPISPEVIPVNESEEAQSAIKPRVPENHFSIGKIFTDIGLGYNIL